MTVTKTRDPNSEVDLELHKRRMVRDLTDSISFLTRTQIPDDISDVVTHIIDLCNVYSAQVRKAKTKLELSELAASFNRRFMGCAGNEVMATLRNPEPEPEPETESELDTEPVSRFANRTFRRHVDLTGDGARPGIRPNRPDMPAYRIYAAMREPIDDY